LIVAETHDMDDPSTASLPIWRDLAERVFASFEGAANNSPTIVRTLEYGSRYATIDHAAGEIVFDLPALYLGVLAAGSVNPEAVTLGNSAAWLSVWLAGKVGGRDAITHVLERFGQKDDPLIAMRQGLKVVSSRSLKALLPQAAAYAETTVSRPRFDMRHLLAAMINGGVVGEMTAHVFNIVLTTEDIEQLALTLFMRVMSAPEPDESREAWREVLSIREAQTSNRDDEEDAAQRAAESAESGVSTSRPPPDDAVSPFNGDTPIADDNDVLDTERDVEALAQLVCLDRVTPLAVAIFGDWGSGKSTFMARLEEAVREMPGREAGQALPLVEEANAARFVHPIVQIRFNAWHFADANLWASLTAEFFDQLRAGGYDRSGQARHAQLVQRVNQHVHALSDTLSANRKAMARNGEAVLEAQKARDTAAEGARKASGKALGQATLDVLSQVLADQKGLMTTLGLTRERAKVAPDADDRKDGEPADGAGQGAKIVVGVVKDLASSFGKLKAIRRVLFRTPLRAVLAAAFATALLGCAAVGWAILFGPWQGVKAPEKWTTLVGLLAVTGALMRTMAPVLKLVNGVAERGAAIAAEVDRADQDAVGLLLTREAKLQSALAEAKALEEVEAASAKALARYVDPTGKANPPRLLRYILEDDPDTKALEKDIGLIGRTRRLFQAVDTIAREVRDQRRTPGYADRKDADWETPERIIIYIDDLDRCHEDKVYEVLQAIHLLLAFELFVVVVGVDVKWVQAALAKQFETGDAQIDAATEQQRNERAMHYLEKIFQIPFWLRPLSSGDEGTFRPFIQMLAGESVETARAKAAATEQARKLAEQSQVFETPNVGSAAGGQAGGVAKSRTGATSGTGDPLDALFSQREVKLVEARRKLQLTNDEIAFLGSPEIAALAATAPRGVKRLVNVYRIARARRGQEDAAAVLGGSGRAPDYPLIALMAAVETGQRFQVADGFYDLLQNGKDLSVRDLISTQAGRPPDGVTMNDMMLLLDAASAAAKLRGGAMTAADLLAAARLVRRYSFNRYR
jgi:hypothetical protein